MYKMEKTQCPFCKKQYKLSYVIAHVERMHTDKDNPKYIEQREKASAYQDTLSKEQIKERARKYYQKHREKILAKQRGAYKENHEEVRKYYEHYYKERADELAAWRKEYYRKNQDQINQKRYEQRVASCLVECSLCKEYYKQYTMSRHKARCNGLDYSRPPPPKKKPFVTCKIVAKPTKGELKASAKLVHMTIKLFTGQEISGPTYFGYHTI